MRWARPTGALLCSETCDTRLQVPWLLLMTMRLNEAVSRCPRACTPTACLCTR